MLAIDVIEPALVVKVVPVPLIVPRPLNKALVLTIKLSVPVKVPPVTVRFGKVTVPTPVLKVTVLPMNVLVMS